MSISASTIAGANHYMSIHERIPIPIHKGMKQGGSVSSQSVAASATTLSEEKHEFRPNVSLMLHYFEALKDTHSLLLPDTLSQLQAKKVSLEKECDDVDSHEMLRMCANHISEYISLAHGAMKLSRQKLFSKYLKAFSNVSLEVHAYYTDRQNIIRKNKHLADAMEMMRDVVDGGSGLSNLTAAQEKLQESEQKIHILRSCFGKGILEVIKDAVNNISSYMEVENSLMLATLAAGAEASRLEGKLNAWTVASKVNKVKAAKHRIAKLRK
jgi:hypothetical protein